MKIFNILFVVIFILFGALQYNDPDPYLWVPIYLYGALMCYMCLRGKRSRTAIWFGIMCYAFYAGYLFVADDGVLSWMRDHHAENIAATMKAERPWIEDSREFFGLVILIVVSGVNLRKK